MLILSYCFNDITWSTWFPFWKLPWFKSNFYWILFFIYFDLNLFILCIFFFSFYLYIFLIYLEWDFSNLYTNSEHCSRCLNGSHVSIISIILSSYSILLWVVKLFWKSPSSFNFGCHLTRYNVSFVLKS